MKLWIREHWCLVLHMLLSIADQEFGLLTGFSVAQDGLELALLPHLLNIGIRVIYKYG